MAQQDAGVRFCHSLVSQLNLPGAAATCFDREVLATLEPFSTTHKVVFCTVVSIRSELDRILGDLNPAWVTVTFILHCGFQKLEDWQDGKASQTETTHFRHENGRERYPGSLVWQMALQPPGGEANVKPQRLGLQHFRCDTVTVSATSPPLNNGPTMAGCYRTFFHRRLREAVEALNGLKYPGDPNRPGVRLAASDNPVELPPANTAGRDYLIGSAAHPLAALIAFGLVYKASPSAREPARPTWALDTNENGIQVPAPFVLFGPDMEWLREAVRQSGWDPTPSSQSAGL
ncbi:hypothetical protein CH063_00185 [Colletotrichum higginsianum]|uniref:Uncharacterized protein n=1 Tax=Colletotrichum higginsianum (strain IMI 349063) TaxID=759273 RepID=H1V405_COLHI|nr:hypothetical protein CH63R_14449 [Colletotrichum higginsianum IMI 349063]OBR02148.1 hypothetical protein CH63R_14449 [Colletotrichum higginsianum IMI 349063]CCF34957.1 hypothetical protein CH063_00185 [Colletotrichum higginsianum]